MTTNTGLAVSVSELLIAYRKAKADAYFERDHNTAAIFGEYEVTLLFKLSALAELLNDPSAQWEIDPEIIGTHSYIPKGLEPDPLRNLTDDAQRAIFIASDPRHQWKRYCALLRRSRPGAKFEAKFRVVGVHPVEFHIICALWIQRVGHKYDASLGSDIRGSRLRRIWEGGGENTGYPNRIAIGSFRRYAPDFRAWRANGLTAIRDSLERKERVVAITSDLKSFYHQASADYLLDQRFLDSAGIELPELDREFTRRMQLAIRRWNSGIPGGPENDWLGLPVGISAPRVVANCLLWGFDRFVNRELNPLYYGRYVDDIFLVLKDTRGFEDADEVWQFLASRSRNADGPILNVLTGGGDDAGIQLHLPYSPNSDLRFGMSKSKVFRLEGPSGFDMLNSIESTIASASSEWRLLPDLPEDDEQVGIEFLSPGRDASAEVDNLRKADGLTVKKLRLAIRLRNLEAVERDLLPEAWSDHRRNFFRAVRMHAICVRGLFEFCPYIPRFIGLAVACRDFPEAIACVDQLRVVFEEIDRDTERDEYKLALCRHHLARAVEEAIAKALVSDDSIPTAETLRPLVDSVSKLGPIRNPSKLVSLGQNLYDRDLARRAWREQFLDDKDRGSHPSGFEPLAMTLDELKLFSLDKALDFLRKIKAIAPNIIDVPPALIFPTRPFTTAEITQLDPSCLEDPNLLRRVAQGVRGATLEIGPEAWAARLRSEACSTDSTMPCYSIYESRLQKDPHVAIACFLTEESSWRSTIAQVPDPNSIDRYFRINRLINRVLKAKPRPDYLVMPELCLPSRWYSRVAYKSGQAGMSVISGIEYKHRYGTTPAASSPVRLVTNRVRAALTTDLFGYPSVVILEQEKSAPALEEERELWSIAKATLVPERAPTKCVLQHGQFRFGLLICSELTDIELRAKFRGRIDCLFVPEWNKDLETFSSLVESSALDVHCFVVQANNRKYGDCRVRAPYREAFMRDLARIKGGEDDYFVVARLDVASLRGFQSRVRSPDKGVFKPVPDGFVLDESRRTVPDA